MRRALLLLLALLTLAGDAEAAAVSGSIASRESALAGEVVVDARNGVLDLAPEASVRPLTVSWASAQGYEVSARSQRYTVGNYTPVSGEPANDTIELGPGALADLACAHRCQFLLLALGDDGHIGIEGVADGPVGRVRTPVTYAAGSLGSPLHPPDAAFHFVVPPGWLRAGRADAGEALALGAARASAGGSLYLYIYGAEGTLVDGHTRAPFWTGSRNVSQQEVAGTVVSRMVETRFVVLRLEGARFESATGALLQLYAPTPQLRVDGTWTASAAHGQVRAGSKTSSLDGQTVAATGALTLAYALEDALSSTALSGDAESVYVDGVALHEDPPAVGKAAAGGLTLVAIVLLALAGLRAAGWLPGYSRIHQEDILENENRRRLLALVHERPGILVTELAAQVGVTEAVVRYHIRMLLRAKLLTTRGIGRVTASYPLVFQLDGSRVNAAAALRGHSRQALASRLLGASSGVTQRDLAQRASMSQRLVAYHLAEMCRLGLVASDDGRPQLYVATPLLREFERTILKDGEPNEMVTRVRGPLG